MVFASAIESVDETSCFPESVATIFSAVNDPSKIVPALIVLVTFRPLMFTVAPPMSKFPATDKFSSVELPLTVRFWATTLASVSDGYPPLTPAFPGKCAALKIGSRYG